MRAALAFLSAAVTVSLRAVVALGAVGALGAVATVGAVTAVTGCAGAPQVHGAYADVGALHMYYEEAGSGRPLVLLHGGGSTAQTSFGVIMPALSRHHRVIAPEAQGHGHTADIDRPMSFEQMADDTDALLARLGIEDADVLGFSNGGMVALQLAIRHPARVRKLVICSAVYARDGAIPPLREAWQSPPDASKMPPALRDAYLAAAPHPDLAGFVTKTIAMLRAFTDIPEATLRTIQAPTLVMVADHDVIRPEHAVSLFELLPHAQLAVFPDSIHGTYLGALEGVKAGSPLPGIAVTMIETFLDAGATAARSR